MTLESASGPAIASRLQRGDREAFGALVERFHDFVHAVALANTRNPDTADDVTQETFLRAMQTIQRLRDPNRVDRWLAVIARNTARSVQRRAAKTEPIESISNDRILSDAPDAARSELRALVRESIAHLNAKQREVLYLHYFTGMTTEEIGKSLSISRHAAKKRLERARTALGERLIVELDDLKEPRGDRDKRVRRVLMMAAAGTLPQAHRMGVAEAISTSIGFAISKPAWVGGVAAVAGAAAIGLYANREATPPPSGNDPVEVATDAQPEDERSDSGELAAVDVDSTTAPEQSASTQRLSTDSRLSRVHELPGMTPKLRRTLNKSVSIEFDEEYIGTILEFVGDYVGINIALDWNAIEPEPSRPENEVERGSYARFEVPPRIVPPNGYASDGYVGPFEYANVSAGEMLYEVLGTIGLSYVTQPGYVWISTPAKLASVPEVPEERLAGTYKTAELLDSLGSVTFEGGDLEDALRSILRESRSGAVVDWQVVQPPNRMMWAKQGEEGGLFESIQDYDAEGFVPYISIRGASLEETLWALLTPIGLDFVPMHDFIWVSSIKRIKADPPVLTVPVTTDPGISAALNSAPLSVAFDHEQLRTILRFLNESGRIAVPIEIDPEVDAEDLIVPFIKAKEMPLRSLLYALLRPQGLDYDIRDDKVVVIER